MREILFRGKRKDNGEWVYGAYLHKTLFYGTECDEHYIIEHGEFDCDNYDGYNVVPETVGQYTGLTDKNGKRIFEGDIVKQNYSLTINARYDPDTLGFIDADSIEGHHIGVVNISSHRGVGMRNPTSYDDIDGTKRKTKRFVNLASYRCEVIGNIHDNPELLKGGGENDG